MPGAGRADRLRCYSRLRGTGYSGTETHLAKKRTMRLSYHFGATLREVPARAEAPGYELLLRGGFIRQIGQGLFSYLPLGWRSVRRIEQILREEMDRIGGQEINMPVVHPADLWKATGRFDTIGPELARLRDRRGRDLVLAMTHEEVVAYLAASELKSYRRLPMLVYHIQTKFRDDPRPRAGLIRAREFIMKDSYSLDVDDAGLNQQYRAHHEAYRRIFQRCGLPVTVVGSDVGMMGGTEAHEFMYLNSIGEDTLVLCDLCGYAANRQVARFRKEPSSAEQPYPLEEVPTPDAPTIADVARFLDVPLTKTAKAVLVAVERLRDGSTETDLVIALVRGDMEVNETKLANSLDAIRLRPMTEDEISGTRTVAGYASPVGVEGVTVVVDDVIPLSANLVVGANKEGFHFINSNYGRDYSGHVLADIAAASEGHACINCGRRLRIERAVEVGNIFKLGTRYSEALGTMFVDHHGHERPVVMGSYGIGVGRVLACIAEEHRDQRGLIWPATVAPHDVHFVALTFDEGDVRDAADRVYGALSDAGLEVLYDDRNESAGVKFADADLIGLPLRVTVSKRSLAAGGAEVKRRDASHTAMIGLEDLASHLSLELERGAAGLGPDRS
jgi:prolyl-tRNA synthetase